MFKLIHTPLPGALLIVPGAFQDRRGAFVKTFHASLAAELGGRFDLQEEFYSISNRNVLRGMHFQVPPKAHSKIVYCAHGAVSDVILDLRQASGAYGQHFATELSGENRAVLFIPRGCAHGFLALTEGAIMVYKTDAVHAPECDAGIRWDTFGYDWPCADPILSERDLRFPAWADFASPF